MGQGVFEGLEVGHIAGEVVLEEFVVGHDDALDHLVVDLVLVLGQLGRQVGRFGVPAVVDEGRVGQHVGDAVEFGLRADGQLQGGEAGAEVVVELRQDPVEVRSVAVQLVDEHHAGYTELLGEVPVLLRLDLDAVDGRHHQDGEVDDPQRGLDVAGEVQVAGSVDEVDAVSSPLERGDGQGE